MFIDSALTLRYALLKIKTFERGFVTAVRSKWHTKYGYCNLSTNSLRVHYLNSYLQELTDYEDSVGCEK
jgi:hypothetical protein